MPLGLYLDTPQGRKPVTLPTHFSLHDFRSLVQRKIGNPEHYDYSLGDVIFRTWNEEAFNRQRSAIRDGVTLIIEYPPVVSDASSQTGPTWRHASPGLCLEGVCLNVNCPAFERKVIRNEGLGPCTIVTNSSLKTFLCPSCQSTVEPTVCAFHRCTWRVMGTRKEGQEPNTATLPTISPEWQNATDDYHRWKDSLAVWSQLSVETKK